MTDQSNPFNGEVTQPTDAPADKLVALLGSIKNEHGEQKYKSVEDALVALQHSQQYIPELKEKLFAEKSEVDSLKEQLAKLGNVEETVKRLVERQSEGQATPAQPTGLDADAVQQLIQSHLQQSQAAQSQAKNLELVVSTLTQVYGDKAAEVIKAKAASTGTTPAKLEALAKEAPQMVLALFGDVATKSPAPSVGVRQGVPPVKVEPSYVKPERSMLSGVTAKDQADNWRNLTKSVHSQLGVNN